jgi:tRNA threonylcarbamoyladenosine biosynthesis protein TsaE
MIIKVVSRSSDETVAIGKKVGKLVAPGDFMALIGELGSGKTQFAKGFIAGGGADAAIPVTSPTFTLMNSYLGKFPLYHFDLYRLSGPRDVVDLGFEEIFYGSGACMVEWAERLGELLPDERLAISFEYIDEERRNIILEPFGARYLELVKTLAKIL